MYKEITKCRVCGSDKLIKVFDLGHQVLTGVFPRSLDHKIPEGPVQLVQCYGENSCGLVQLKQSYDSSEMYGLNYGYRSGLNISMVKHLQDKVNKILKMDVLSEGDYIIDIGSNDATTLRNFPSGHYNLIGVDPTGVKFSKFYPSDVDLISDFFSSNIIKKNYCDIKAKVITSFSMFYDLEEPVVFAADVAKTLHKDGVWILEQSYLPFMLQANSFDTICHEHLEFYSLTQINWIANKVGLTIKNVEFNNINGGSFSIELVHKNSQHISNERLVSRILKDEEEMGLAPNGEAFKNFKIRINEEKEKFWSFLKTTKMNNKKVVGLGASTKGNVLLQYYNINQTNISCIGEINPDKFGSYTPKTLIPLVPEDEMLEQNPDYIVVLPWHFKEFFISQRKFKGKKLVFPLPNFHIVNC